MAQNLRHFAHVKAIRFDVAVHAEPSESEVDGVPSARLPESEAGVESEASIQVRPIEQLIGFVVSVALTQIHVVSGRPILQEGTVGMRNANRWAENQTWPWPRPSGNHKLRPFVRNAADNAYRSSEIQHRERENGDRSSEMHRKSASGTRE